MRSARPEQVEENAEVVEEIPGQSSRSRRGQKLGPRSKLPVNGFANEIFDRENEEMDATDGEKIDADDRESDRQIHDSVEGEYSVKMVDKKQQVSADDVLDVREATVRIFFS